MYLGFNPAPCGTWVCSEDSQAHTICVTHMQALPLARYSYQFNERLLAVVNTALPSSPNVDVMAAVAAAAEQGSTVAPDIFSVERGSTHE